MDIDRFWAIVEDARTAARESGVPVHEVLVDRLSELSVPEILAYGVRYDEAHDAVYRWDMWAAAYLIFGGCSDDGFVDFRAGLIAAGRTWYERAAADPDCLAGHPDAAERSGARLEEVFAQEEVGYAAAMAYERVTGDLDGFHAALERHEEEAGAGAGAAEAVGDVGDDSMGEYFRFDDDEMRRRLPRLAALFVRG
ncbi:DUF4240 domain-containing protein [Streptodolium elevatio]|uniref:DUF4240 domain-containing protein n=1 Tax=Streptodolium elevatio TaxID=3157996 RepID=A0ABV3DGV4_9ACTN